MIDSLPNSLETLKIVEMNLNNNKVAQLPSSLAQCPRLKVLRVEQNELILSGIPDVLLMDSKVSLLAVEGNNFSMKDLEEMPGYDKVKGMFILMVEFIIFYYVVFGEVFSSKKKAGLNVFIFICKYE